MTKKDAEQLLLNYSVLQGKQRYNLARADGLKVQMEREKARMAEDLAQPARRLTGMPGSGRLSDPTAEAGAKLADGYRSELFKALEKELQDAETQQALSEARIAQADALLSMLMRKERFLVEGKLVRQMSWQELIRAYDREFGYAPCLSGIRKAYARAMDIICAGA